MNVLKINMTQGLTLYWGYRALTKRNLSWLPSERPNKQLKESDARIHAQPMDRNFWLPWLN
jgi:hypothetical protein